MTDPTRCCKQVWDNYRSYQCSRKVWNDGYCKQHHPDTVAERQRKSREAYEAKRKTKCWYKLKLAQEENERLRDALQVIANRGVPIQREEHRIARAALATTEKAHER